MLIGCRLSEIQKLRWEHVDFEASELHTARFTTAGNMLGELAAVDSDSLLQRKLRFYARQQLLVIDEVGYLSYSNRHADLLFNTVTSRSQQRSTIVTTNRPFAEWAEAFPNAACVVALVDRLVHNAQIIAIEGDSYRRKEARGAPELAQSATAGVQQVADELGRMTLQPPGCNWPRNRGSSQTMERAAAGARPARLSPQRDRPIPRPTTPSCATSANMCTSRPSLTLGVCRIYLSAAQ